jgi:hypothetical protein
MPETKLLIHMAMVLRAELAKLLFSNKNQQLTN